MPGSVPDSHTLAALSTAGADTANRSTAAEQEVVALFDQLRDRLLRYLMGFSLAVADSEDIVQETFLALFQHLRSGKSRHHLRGWLFRVAHNLALKHRQAQRDSKSVPESLIHPAPNPEDQFATNQTQKRLIAVMQALPEQHRCCLYLRAEGLSYREIAEVLNMSLGSVSLCMGRSLARIARAAER